MPKITVPHSDVTTEEAADALRQRFDHRDDVPPGTGINPRSASMPGPDHGSDQPGTFSVVVVSGSDAVLPAEGAIPRHSGRTDIDVRPGGPPGAWSGALNLVDRISIARDVSPGPPLRTRAWVTLRLLTRRFANRGRRPGATAES